MADSLWTPHLTVAAVIEQGGRFLLVEELSGGKAVFNQPAGHVERGESVVEAVRREVVEESGYRFTPEQIIGIYRWHNPLSGIDYLRIALCGPAAPLSSAGPLEEGILATHWLSRDQLLARRERLRSPMVLHAIDDYLAGLRYPLDLVREIPSS